MDTFGWLPTRYITLRGWGFLAAGTLALLLAQVMGRRDLLTLGVFLVGLPLLAAAAMVLLKPQFTVERKFRPAAIETGVVAQVELTVRRSGGLAGLVYMEEHLPLRFGKAPSFRFPARHPSRSGASIYEYKLRSNQRGLFAIGPVTADFTDPFGLANHRHHLGETSPLVVTPAPVQLPATSLTGARGSDGTASTRRQANPSDDDVMTREYRYGDAMRRVHWAATARHGELMVRQEESVTTPQATIVLDRRASAFGTGLLPSFGDGGSHHGDMLHTSPSFEWAVTAVASAANDFLQRNYTVRLLDIHAAAAVLESPSAPSPGQEEFDGPAGYQDLAEGLAALGLAEDHRKSDRHPAAPAFGDRLMDKLAAHKYKGPLVAVLGQISSDEARLLAPAAEFGSHAFALIVTDRPQHARAPMDVLRAGGWRTVAVSPKASVSAAWAHFDLADRIEPVATGATP